MGKANENPFSELEVELKTRTNLFLASTIFVIERLPTTEFVVAQESVSIIVDATIKFAEVIVFNNDSISF